MYPFRHHRSNHWALLPHYACPFPDSTKGVHNEYEIFFVWGRAMTKRIHLHPPSLVGVLAMLLLSPLMFFSQVAQTTRQIEHSKLFENYGLKGHKLTDGKGDGGFAADIEVPAYLTVPSRSEYFAKLACESDAVVVGKVVNQTALLSPDESMIFTDVEISVVETLKDNPKSHIYPNQSITVTRPGGSLELNGRKLSVVLSNFKDFSVGGQYLLFLKLLPTTLDYEAFWDRTFELRGGLIFNLSKYVLWDGQNSSKQDSAAALVDARVAASTSCK